ncbi:DUF547 domain-containing protein [Porphyrobacter sp. AAP60]|uniref:DUF547 domain-containing protein n=1 Tax=Porphyrobacter sp. AAP60 TaxID=1523423 RepID=UPI0006B96CDE|nr:DUF547 domain-containing protein [Porphyrobacter sp. AAP60]KPF65609.1 hypothetical protein IP79_00200 [Porphyrobacter sp. AAP60]
MVPKYVIALVAGSVLVTPALASELVVEQPRPADDPGLHYVPPIKDAAAQQRSVDDHLAAFAPTTAPIRHTIDYEIWDWALKNILISMGPSDRLSAPSPPPLTGSRLKSGPQSRYRLEGSLVLFRFFDQKVIASFSEYRQDLESVVETLDISTLPRNEQLAYWINLHNVAMMEQIAKEWPVREPREIAVDGVPLDQAKFINLRGIPVSLRDIRENIVYRHWKNPKVIYGFWRGEIGGPQLQSYAFTGANVTSLLDVAAADFVNSLRGTQKIHGKLAVSELYAEVAPFYFPDFENDLRAHLAVYAEEPVKELMAKTGLTVATIREADIADLHGGARPPAYLLVDSQPGVATDQPVCNSRWGQAACDLLVARSRKLQRMKRRDQPISRVFFSNIDLPGDPPNKNAVE